MIPLSTPTLAGNEWAYVKTCIDTGWISSAGKFVDRFETELAEFVGARYAVATSNGSSALHIALLATGCGASDIVLLPNLTFVASANAVRYVNAEPVFIDVDPTYWQMDADLLEDYLSTQCAVEAGTCVRKKDLKPVKFLMPVHTLGDIGNMARLADIAERFALTIIEDSTEALGSNANGKNAGLFGTFGTFSFNGNKIISTGGGGAIVTDDAQLAGICKHMTTQAKVPGAGYFHDQVGYNYRLVNVLAAIGVAQLEQLPGFLARKKQIAAIYRERLANVGDIQFPSRVDGVQANCWLNTFHTNKRDAVLQALARAEIEARPFWVPMNQLPMYLACEYQTAQDQSARLHLGCVSIPSSADLTDEQAHTVCNAIAECF